MGGKHKPETRAAWRAANREHIRAYSQDYNRRYYHAHRKKLLAKNKIWQKEVGCTEEFKERYRERKRRYERAYYAAHREERLAKSKESQRRYYQEHREEILRYQRERKRRLQSQIVPAEPTQPALPTPTQPLPTIAPQVPIQPKHPIHDTSTATGKLQQDIQQLYDDVAARVAEMEKLFNGWE